MGYPTLLHQYTHRFTKMQKPKIYYAHSMHLYGTPQEARDIATLEGIGSEVLNPNSPEISKKLKKWIEGGKNVMNFFDQYIKTCDLIAFRAYPDGTIGSGVAYEVKKAGEFGIPVIELPNLLESRYRSYEDTKVMLQLLGER